jgi:uncharacterized protein (TIGR02246 family)
MNKLLGMCAAVLLLAGPAVAQMAQPTTEPQTARSATATETKSFRNKAPDQVIGQLQSRVREFEQAWNKHDLAAISSQFAKDATYLSPDGTAVTGQREIREYLTEQHEGAFKSSRADLKLTSVRTISPTVAVIDVTMTATGLQPTASGQQLPSRLHTTVVASKVGNVWMIQAMRVFPEPGEQQMGVGGAGETDESSSEDDTGESQVPQ